MDNPRAVTAPIQEITLEESPDIIVSLRLALIGAQDALAASEAKSSGLEQDIADAKAHTQVLSPTKVLVLGQRPEGTRVMTIVSVSNDGQTLTVTVQG